MGALEERVRKRSNMENNQVEIRYRGSVHTVVSGMRVDEFLQDINGGVPDTVLSALVNRRQVMLDFPLRGQVDLELVNYGDREGESCLLYTSDAADELT